MTEAFALRIEAIDQSAPPHLARIQFGASADFSTSSGTALYGKAFLVLCFSRLRSRDVLQGLAITLAYVRRFHNRNRIAERDKTLAFLIGGTTAITALCLSH